MPAHQREGLSQAAFSQANLASGTARTKAVLRPLVDNPFPFLPDHPHTRVALNRIVLSTISQATEETSLTGKNRASPRRSALAPWRAASPDTARPGSHL